MVDGWKVATTDSNKLALQPHDVIRGNQNDLSLKDLHTMPQIWSKRKYKIQL